MTRRKAVRLGVLLLLTFGMFGLLLMYRSSARRARTPVVIIQNDRSDIQAVMGSQAPVGYDPYFTRVNLTPGIVASGTNVVLTIDNP